jgi:hypothetical protein
MGKVRIVGDITKKEFQLLEEVANEVRIKNASDDVVLLKADSTSITDALGVKLSTHASRHRADGSDPMFYVPFGSDTTISVNAGETQAIPSGMYYVKCGDNTKVQVYIGGAWTDFSSVGAFVFVASDGQNVRLNNTGASSENSTIRRVA